MRIGIISPVATADVRHLLDVGDVMPLPPGYPGAPFIATLITTYLGMGHDVVAFTSDRSLHPSNDPQYLDGPGFRLWLCPARPNGTFPRHGRLGRICDFFSLERQKLALAVAQEKIDILHAHWTYEFAMVAQESGIPAIATMHDVPEDILRFTLSPYYFGRYLMARRILARGLPLTVVSGYLADRLAQKGISPADVIANPLPVWLKDLEPVRGGFPVNGRFPVISMVAGYWNGFKNPLPGIKAFANIRQTTGQAPELHLYGPDFGPNGKAEKYIRAAGVRLDGIKLRGGVPHRKLLEELSGSDALVHTAITESFGMAVAEAMALGVPIIGGIRSGAIPWLLEHGAAGQLVDVMDVAAVEAAILRVLQRPDEIRVLASHAQKRIWQIASPEAIAGQYLNAYHRVLNNLILPHQDTYQGLA
jgi:glycosyltransferase involved in cell wall biosynthesis